jgi:hypothetical protein
MKSPHFQYPFRHFPYPPRRVSGDAPGNLFSEIAGDQGLRNAVNFYWNTKTITPSGSWIEYNMTDFAPAFRSAKTENGYHGLQLPFTPRDYGSQIPFEAPEAWWPIEIIKYDDGYAWSPRYNIFPATFTITFWDY